MPRRFPGVGRFRSGRSFTALGAFVLVACGSTVAGVDMTSDGSPLPNPLSGLVFFVESDSPARRQADQWRDERPDDARLMEEVAGRPQAVWFGDWNDDVRADVSRRVAEARGQGSVPVLVAYDIPFRDCGSHSAGGAASADAYRAWIDGFAAGLDGAPSLVIVEPDAVAAADCLDDGQRAERYALLDYAVRALKSVPGTFVYLDAGNPTWKAAGEMRARLRRAGVDAADGFALNVSNTVDTDLNIRYGSELSALLDDAHFVIDTSRNGVGAPVGGEWCNPPGRALGPAPTADTGHPLVDAFLWVKRPGESDGECNGGPPAGRWWPEYALDLASRAYAAD